MERAIRTQADVVAWSRSPAHASLCGLVAELSTAVAGKGTSHAVASFPAIAAALSALESLAALVDEVPPEARRQRFGNAAFRTWHERMAATAGDAMASLVPAATKATLVAEMIAYWTTSFGNPQRIDFGTGHEAAFVMWIYAWLQFGELDGSDPRVLTAVGLRLVPAYLRVTRKLQTVYNLEPAGSHGVWSLDDYHLLPFLLGSAQLDGHSQKLSPKSALSEEVTECYAEEFLYLAAVHYVRVTKTGARFDEVAPLISTIAKQVPTWGAINVALRAMFAEEVLGKFPVAQHFLFGTALPADWTAGAAGSAAASPPVPPAPAGAKKTPAVAAASHVFRSPGDSVLQRFFGLGRAAGSSGSRARDVSMGGRVVRAPQRGGGGGARPASGSGSSGSASIRGWDFSATTGALAGEDGLAAIEAAGANSPLPEMVFDKNVVTLRHVGSGFEVQINARDALIACPDTCSGDLLVPCAELWKSAKHVDMEGRPIVAERRQYDWTFGTLYAGTVLLRGTGGGGAAATTSTSTAATADSAVSFAQCAEGDGIEYELLKRREPILWNSSSDLFESELDDNGTSELSVKVRVMPSCYFLLMRHFLRLDSVVIRVRDTRIFHRFGSPFVYRERTYRAVAWDELAALGLSTDIKMYRRPDYVNAAVGKLTVVEKSSEKATIGSTHGPLVAGENLFRV